MEGSHTDIEKCYGKVNTLVRIACTQVWCYLFGYLTILLLLLYIVQKAFNFV